MANFQSLGQPRGSTSALSNIFFCWIFPLIRRGYRRDLELEDVYRVGSAYRTRNLKDRLEGAWNKEVKYGELNDDNEPSLFKSLTRAFGLQFGGLVFLGILQHAVLKVAQPLLMGYLLLYFNGEVVRQSGYISATALILVTLASTVIFHALLFFSQTWALKVRIALTSLIYQKALRLSQKSLSEASIGQITNFMSNDVNRLDRYCIQMPYLIIAPVQLVIVTFVLWKFTGPSCLAGVILLILAAPTQGWAATYFTTLRRVGCARTDARLQLMNEIVNGILLIKMFCWEKPFAVLVEKARLLEMSTVSRKTRLDMLNKGLFPVFGKVVVLVTLVVYVFTGNLVVAAQIFVVLSLYEAIRQPACMWFPIAILGWAEILVSFRRIQKFLMLEEREMTGISSNDPDPGASTPKLAYGLTMEKFCGKWAAGPEYTLENVDLELGPAQFKAVIGHVGSGKSSLLYALLNELPPVFGQVKRNGTLAYASQDPWLFAGSIRENILFGLGFNPMWYAQVLEACALNADLAGFPLGDGTLVYDRGINLSGGQKARVNLARAVYSNAQIYLLDDPLSAVDAKAGRHIFEKCISGLLKNKAVLLVTHQLQYLDTAHEIIMLSNGRVESRGTLAELTSQGKLTGLSSRTASPVNFEIDDDAESGKGKDKRPESPQPSVDEMTVDVSETALLKAPESTKVLYGTFKEQAQEKEEMSKGSVGLKIYWSYFRSGNTLCLLVSLVLSLILAQAFFNGSDYWLKVWTGKEELGFNVASGNEEKFYLWVYCGLIGLLLVFSVLRFQIMARVFTNTSLALHKATFDAVIRAPMRFFEINSAGRVFNRFSNDMGIVDETLPQLASTTVGIWLEVLGDLVVVGITNPVTLVPGVGLLVVLFLLAKIYLRTGSSLKRLEAVYRSPVFGHTSTSLNGIATIRAFRKAETFQLRYYDLQDTHSSTAYLSYAAARWLGVTLDWFTNVYFICIVTGFFFIMADSATVGLAISTALAFTSSLSWTASRSTDIENNLVSVERIIEYSKVKPEAPLEIPAKQPPSSWPAQGEIQFNRVSVQYGHSAPVLHNISCSIRGGEKVGIVGRTGAGKSTLISALFRIVEPSSGQINIDGRNVLEMGLHDLRSRIAIIPQNPILFQGTMRRNLDPLDQYSDHDLWACLDQVHLSERVHRGAEAGLETQISEGGSNFSQGERQLICLARALLGQAKILVLDEATANMDSETDALIQKVVNEKFQQSTILTIAHRLDTVMRSDRILVLDSGTILEFDEPHVLLEKKGKLFELVQRTGAQGFAHLSEIANEAHEQRLHTQV